jgi:hypothetical protein
MELWPPFSGFLDHTHTQGRTLLDEWSARRRDLYLHRTTQHTDTKRQTSIPRAGFESATPATKRPQTYALDRAATGIGIRIIVLYILRFSFLDKTQFSVKHFYLKFVTVRRDAHWECTSSKISIGNSFKFVCLLLWEGSMFFHCVLMNLLLCMRFKLNVIDFLKDSHRTEMCTSLSHRILCKSSRREFP